MGDLHGCEEHMLLEWRKATRIGTAATKGKKKQSKVLYLDLRFILNTSIFMSVIVSGFMHIMSTIPENQATRMLGKCVAYASPATACIIVGLQQS